MRQALFDEYQQTEWQARVEAIRERLDEQRQERQEQERAQEQADRQAAAQHEQEADRQALIDSSRARMASSLQWHGDRLLPGEHCEVHLVEFRNVIKLEDTGSYRYANDYAYVALRNAIDERPRARAVKLLMLSLDRDLAVDIQSKSGATADDDNQLQVQAYATPDDEGSETRHCRSWRTCCDGWPRSQRPWTLSSRPLKGRSSSQVTTWQCGSHSASESSAGLGTACR